MELQMREQFSDYESNRKFTEVRFGLNLEECLGCFKMDQKDGQEEGNSRRIVNNSLLVD